MLKRIFSLGVVALVAALSVSPLEAQDVGLAGFGYQGVTVGGAFGGLYTFDRLGFDRTQHDIAWQAGVTLSF